MVRFGHTLLFGLTTVLAVSMFGVGCTPAAAPTPEEAARATFPGRPIVIPIERIDPCDLLQAGQAARLRVERIGGSSVVDVNGSPSRICAWIDASSPGQGSESPPVGVNVQFISIPTEVAAGANDSVVGQVNGYGSVMQKLGGSPGEGPICQVAIDAAPGQSIRVQALLRPYGPQLSDDELCRRATDAASMVMTTAVAIAAR